MVINYCSYLYIRATKPTVYLVGADVDVYATKVSTTPSTATRLFYGWQLCTFLRTQVCTFYPQGPATIFVPH